MTVKTTKFIHISLTIFFIYLMYYFISHGCLTDPIKLETLILSFGIFAPFIFLLLQIIQVIFPIIPGGLSNGIGVILFGPIHGFILNYLGSMIGSIIAFLLVKKYGENFILKFTQPKTYNKYMSYLNKGKKFDIIFAIAIFLPGLPDDLLCMIAGLTNMNLKKFIIINALCKPFSLFIYSWGIKEFLMYLTQIL